MNKYSGFTFIELLIVVAIVAVLAGFAFTNYQSYVKKTNRSEAKSELLRVATLFQRCYTLQGRYNSDDCEIYETFKDGSLVSDGRGFYTLDDTSITATAFTIKATASKLPQTDDTGCTELTVTHTGAKTPSACW